MAIIAHASINELGKTTGGTLGDNSRQEVCTRTWYNKPWGCVIRLIDADMREKVAKCMEQATANDHIGYDQNKRNTLLNLARQHGYDVSKVTEDCATDCSALVTLACIYAGIPENKLVTNGNSATTRTLKQMLKATGEVNIYTTSDYTQKSDKLIRGDILLKEGSHVVVVTQGDGTTTATGENPYKLTETLLKRCSRGESVKWLQYELVKRGYIVAIDGIYGQKTYSAVCLLQKNTNGKLAVDGKAGTFTLKYLKEN